MPKPHQRSTSLRKVKKKLPGGGLKQVFLRRKPKKAVCASCRKPLSGVARGRPYKIKKLAKTQRRPERPYGGVLCSSCTRKLNINKAKDYFTKLIEGKKWLKLED